MDGLIDGPEPLVILNRQNDKKIPPQNAEAKEGEAGDSVFVTFCGAWSRRLSA